MTNGKIKQRPETLKDIVKLAQDHLFATLDYTKAEPTVDSRHGLVLLKPNFWMIHLNYTSTKHKMLENDTR